MRVVLQLFGMGETLKSVITSQDTDSVNSKWRVQPAFGAEITPFSVQCLTELRQGKKISFLGRFHIQVHYIAIKLSVVKCNDYLFQGS